MKNTRRIIAYVMYVVIGAVLLVLGLLEQSDAFWSGMGGAFIAVGAIRIIQYLRYRNDEDYRERQQIENKDERNRFIRNKAWAWAGYSFVMIAAICTIVFKLIGQDLLSSAAGIAVCTITLLYWICFLILKRKY